MTTIEKKKKKSTPEPKLLIGAIAALLLVAWALPAFAVPPVGRLRLWDALPVIGSDPTNQITDETGVTRMVARPGAILTIITAYENMNGGGHLPCGVTYWNPVTNEFCWFGWTGGTDRDVSMVQPGTPELFNTSPGFPVRRFGPGDVWNLTQGAQLVVHFRGTGAFTCEGFAQGDDALLRLWSTGLNPVATMPDPETGYLWITTNLAGPVIRRLDPGLNLAKEWTFSGLPGSGRSINLAVEPSGAGSIYFTVDDGVGGANDYICRINPEDDSGKCWQIPGGGIGTSGFVSGGIDRVLDGTFVFAETSSGEVGRLTPWTDEICEYFVAGMSDVRLVSASGVGGEFQMYASEAIPNMLTIITDVEASTCVTCATATVVTPTVAVRTFTPDFTEVSFTPTFAIIEPEEFDLTATTCEGPTTGTTCASGEEVTGILRFNTTVAGSGPAGVTGVVRVSATENAMFGDFEGSDTLFQFTSCALIAPPDPPIILVTECGFQDFCSGVAGDVIMDPGEVVTQTVGIQNVGGLPAVGVEGFVALVAGGGTPTAGFGPFGPVDLDVGESFLIDVSYVVTGACFSTVDIDVVGLRSATPALVYADELAECDNVIGDGKIACESCLGCISSSIDPIYPVRMVKTGVTEEDIALTWPLDPGAESYSTWWVTSVGTKVDIPDAREGGPWPSVVGCYQRSGTTCLHPAAVPGVANDLFFYQVRGVCGVTEAPE